MGIAVLFPGQGTQMSRMGEPWRAHPAWGIVERAESVLGEPLSPLLLEVSEASLSRTRDAQLAVVLISLMAWEAVRDQVPEPIAFAGHSLGQVTALVASGALSLEDGVRLAVRRSECTQRAADRHAGRMAALIGGTLEEVEVACRPDPSDRDQDCWVANDNAPGQVVIGGTPDGVEAAGERARRLGVRKVLPLNVGGAFHTPLMETARLELIADLMSAPFGVPAAPVLSNVDGLAYQDADGWRSRLGDQLVLPVRWRATMQALVSMGTTRLLEVGPGSVLGGLARRAAPGTEVRNVAVPDDVPSLMEVA